MPKFQFYYDALCIRISFKTVELHTKLKKKYQILRYIFFDLISAVIAWISFFAVRKILLGELPATISAQLFANAMVIGVFWLLFYTLFGFYRDIFKKSRTREFLRLFTVTCLGVIIIFFLLLLDDSGVHYYKEYYKTFFAYLVLQFCITAFFKMLEISRVKRLIRLKKIRFNTLLVGGNAMAKDIYDEIEKSYEMLGLNFIGYVHIHQDLPNIFNGCLKNLGDYKEIANIIKQWEVNQVIIAIELSEHQKISDILSKVESPDVRISIIPDIYQLLIGSVKVSHTFDIPLIEINKDLIPIWQKVLKRTIDMVVSLFVMIIGFPFYIFISAATKITSKGPVIYSQERIGKDGVPFKMYKFRSMVVDAEAAGPSLSSEQDPRITSWGRFMRRTRIDEFPQFYNVLIGEMSLVGPRPERKFFIDQIVKIAPHYKHLHRVKPGITSLGQVKFGYAENVEEMVKRLKYDILYIENFSPAMDFRIILYTLLIVLQGRGK
jgi:exopolysaccharide biosynthesis polyprenyl glycosylphosphotransferase